MSCKICKIMFKGKRNIRNSEDNADKVTVLSEKVWIVAISFLVGVIVLIFGSGASWIWFGRELLASPIAYGSISIASIIAATVIIKACLKIYRDICEFKFNWLQTQARKGIDADELSLHLLKYGKTREERMDVGSTRLLTGFLKLEIHSKEEIQK